MSPLPTIKVPKRSDISRIERALVHVPQDGKWHRLFTMGFTTAEQTARGYNSPWSPWEFGYHHETKDNEVVSVLSVRHV